MKKCMSAMVIAMAIGCGVMDAQAIEGEWNWSPLGVGIAAPVQLPPMSADVYGLRFGGLLGVNKDVYGIDAGLVEVTSGTMVGLQAAGFTWSDRYVYGVQVGAVANVVKSDAVALQAGFANVNYGESAVGAEIGVVNYSVSYYGLAAGLINWKNYESMGAEFGIINVCMEDYSGLSIGAINNVTRLSGCQLGVFNFADEATGCQIGLINAAERMGGVQFGLLNLICQSKLPLMLIANASF